MLQNIVHLKAGETYALAKGIEVIKEYINDAYSVKIYDPPPSLLNEITPYLANKEITIYLPPKTKIAKDLRPYLAGIKNRIKATYHGQIMTVGCIRLANIIFDIIWQDNEIYDISALTVSKCLACSHRLNLYDKATRNNLIFGSVLATSQAVNEIEGHLRQVDWALFTNVPPEMVSSFSNVLQNKKIKLILPHGAEIPPHLKTIKHKRVFPGLLKTSSRVYGREVQCGSICLPHIHFGIGWEKDEIISVRTFELPECVQCVLNAHKLGWHFCKRIR